MLASRLCRPDRAGPRYPTGVAAQLPGVRRSSRFYIICRSHSDFSKSAQPTGPSRAEIPHWGGSTAAGGKKVVSFFYYMPRGI